MAVIMDLDEHTDHRGTLCVLEKQIPFSIRRAYWISGAHGVRGGHAHKNTMQGMICVHGRCRVQVRTLLPEGQPATQPPAEDELKVYELHRSNQLLILDPEDWHTMSDFSADAVLLVFASQPYDKNDYIVLENHG